MTTEDFYDPEVLPTQVSAGDSAKSPEKKSRSRTGKTLFCNECGVQNPVGARFCNHCGSRITVIPRGDTTDADQTESDGRPAAEPGAARQVGIIVGAGLLIVLVWYLSTILIQDQRRDSSVTPSGPGLTALRGPLPAQIRNQETSLRSEIDNSSGDTQIGFRRELIDLYVSASRIDLAASEALVVAELEDTETMWVATAILYFDWMEVLEPAEKASVAKKSIEAYRRALAINPENLDARTDMAIAYMYDPENPQLAIQETLKVLEYDSLHVNANFNRAIMLLQINRVEQALEQLEKVKRIVGDPDDPVYQRAEQAIKETRTDG